MGQDKPYLELEIKIAKESQSKVRNLCEMESLFHECAFPKLF